MKRGFVLLPSSSVGDNLSISTRISHDEASVPAIDLCEANKPGLAPQPENMEDTILCVWCNRFTAKALLVCEFRGACHVITRLKELILRGSSPARDPVVDRA